MYLEAAASRTKALSPEDYFDPFISGLIEQFRAKGVESSDKDIDFSKQSTNFYRDFENQKDYERKKSSNPKGDIALEHDLLLWHHVRERRPLRTASLLEAVYWIVTIDFSFIAFDTFKRRREIDEPPICLHPTSLTQLFQFWVPRTEKFEKAVFESLKLPFLFYSYNSEDEEYWNIID